MKITNVKQFYSTQLNLLQTRKQELKKQLEDLPAYGQLRGFVFKDPLAYMPGEKVYDFGQLLTFLTHVREGKDLFAKERQLLLLEMHNPCKDYRGRLLDFLNIRCM